MKTALTDRFGIEYPVMSAGMARVAQAPLVAAVSEAGGMGCLGGVSYLADALRDEIHAIRALTAAPFAVNLLVPPSLLDDSVEEWEPVRRRWEHLSAEERDNLRGVEPMLTPGAVAHQVEVVLAERPAAVVLTFDAPRWFVEDCHARGIAVFCLVGSVSRAEQAQAAEADFVVAQGTEGGGHTGYVATMVLVPAVVDAVQIPVLAAGGIVDGRGLAAARCLGAHGVWMGTRFVASVEAYGHAAYKQRVVEAGSKHTTLSRAYTGKPLRTFRNRWTDAWEGRGDEIAGFPEQYAVAGARVESGYQDGDVDEGMMPAGQGVEVVHEILPAGDIVRGVVAEAEAVLARVAPDG
ncbi:MAG TPA: nitronate monooxygenase [Ilumatobacter sp.]|nr:nitronate monooxygenase [Ilumatobacter sp.]